MNIDMSTVSSEIREEINGLMAKIADKMPAQNEQPGSVSRGQVAWLLEEDRLMQLLRLNRFPYKQIQTVIKSRMHSTN